MNKLDEIIDKHKENFEKRIKQQQKQQQKDIEIFIKYVISGSLAVPFTVIPWAYIASNYFSIENISILLLLIGIQLTGLIVIVRSVFGFYRLIKNIS